MSVWFDDLEIRHKGAIIAQEIHYDPWGLELVGVGKAGLDKFTFNAQSEKQKDLADGKGYFYETDFRGYDAQIGRFHGYDLLASAYSGISPYQFAFNNPVMFNDPTGLMPNNDCPKCEELAQKYAARADRIRATPILPIFSSPDPSNHTNVKDIQPIKPNQNNQKNPQTTQTQKKTTHQEGRTNIGRVMGILGRVLKWVGSKSLGIVNLMFSPSNLNEGEAEWQRQNMIRNSLLNLQSIEELTDEELLDHFPK